MVTIPASAFFEGSIRDLRGNINITSNYEIWDGNGNKMSQGAVNFARRGTALTSRMAAPLEVAETGGVIRYFFNISGSLESPGLDAMGGVSGRPKFTFLYSQRERGAPLRIRPRGRPRRPRTGGTGISIEVEDVINAADPASGVVSSARAGFDFNVELRQSMTMGTSTSRGRSREETAGISIAPEGVGVEASETTGASAGRSSSRSTNRDIQLNDSFLVQVIQRFRGVAA